MTAEMSVFLLIPVWYITCGAFSKKEVVMKDTTIAKRPNGQQAATFGNLVDSILGATLERKGHLSNNAVNFLNTFAAAALTWLLIKLFY